jgi:hypothetical protein
MHMMGHDPGPTEAKTGHIFLMLGVLILVMTVIVLGLVGLAVNVLF